MTKLICTLYTETNGLHKTNETVSKKNLYNFARLVCINYEIGYYSENNYNIVKSKRQLVKPRNMYISPETIKYHNITQEIANNTGEEIETILKEFKEDLKKVEVIVSHNIDFHLKTILSEYVRYNMIMDFSNMIIIDTINFNHKYEYPKLKDLATEIKVKGDNNLILIRNIFIKLYQNFEKIVNG
jgi:DNA polymerase III epsilon subunit-like protein